MCGQSRRAQWIVTIINRSLFLLHGAILDTSETSEAEGDYSTKQMSRAALDMTCQLIVDVSRYHLQTRMETLPICCYYNLRAAIKCLQERNKSIGSREVSRDIECLLQSQKIYSSKWLFYKRNMLASRAQLMDILL